jgi:hypothetical protein
VIRPYGKEQVSVLLQENCSIFQCFRPILALPPTPFVQPVGLQSFLPQPIRSHKKPSMPESTSELFTAGLCSRTLLDTNPPTIQIRCLQPGCSYTPKP